jgi:hypothetical protein
MRTGRMNLRDTGDLAAAGRGPRFAAISDRLNENPNMLLEALIRLRFHVSRKCYIHINPICQVLSFSTDYYRPCRAEG